MVTAATVTCTGGPAFTVDENNTTGCVLDVFIEDGNATNDKLFVIGGQAS